MKGCLIIGVVGLLLIGLLGWFVIEPSRLRITLSPDVLPVGDSMHLVAEQIRTFGNEPMHMTISRTQGQYPRPLRDLFKWSVAASDDGRYAPGAAHVDQRGTIVGMQPGKVQVVVTAFGKTGTKDVYIVPRIVSIGTEPAQLTLRVGEKSRLVFRLRLEDGKPLRLAPEPGFPYPESNAHRNASSPHVEVSRPFYAAHVDEWWLDVEGKAPGNTTMYLLIGPRELPVPITVLADTFKVDPHATGLANELLHQSGYGWQTRDFKHGHIHYLRGSHADNHQAALVALVDSARYRAAAWSVGNDDDPIELFFVDTRDQLQELVRTRDPGVFRSGERTALFLYNAEFTPLLVQELLQLYAHDRWGPPRNGPWLSVGWGASIASACQGYDLHEVMRGQKQDGRVRPWREFARDFESIDEIDAMLQAASMVDYLSSLQVPLSELWHTEGWAVAERKTGRSVAQLDSAWQQTLDVHYPAKRVDREKFYREGCS